MRSVRTAFPILLLGVLGWAGTAAAAPPSAADVARIEPVFGNTVVSTYTNGQTAKLWLERDGSYTGEGRKGGASSGRWSLKPDQICLKQSTPIPIPFAFCTPLPQASLAAGWSTKAVTGDQIQVHIAPGNGG